MTFAWLLEWPDGDGNPGGKFYLGTNGVVVCDSRSAHRFTTADAAAKHRSTCRHFAGTLVVEHGF